MGSNGFGTLFRIVTWGESHGKALGVVIDGCPAGLKITEEEIQQELARRRPGRSTYTSPRQELDRVQILSGVWEGCSTGAPLSMLVWNQDAASHHYTPIQNLLRPGHANFTYLEKYGVFDPRGGGRASARETVARVAAGAVAKKILAQYHIDLVAYIKEIGGIPAVIPVSLTPTDIREQMSQHPLLCPDHAAACLMQQKLEVIQQEGDSLGGVIECTTGPLPVGLGDPIYEKLEANLAKAMLTLPATKGIEFGAGFAAARMRGSEHNDLFMVEDGGKIVTKTNHAGGTLGGISTGMPLVFRVAFKPTSSIRKEQPTLDLEGNQQTLKLPEGSRHDPCVALRAIPIVEAMTALVLVDALLMARCARLEDYPMPLI